MAESKKLRKIYHSVCKRHKIGADKIQREVREGEAIMLGSHVITFEEGFFATDNAREQKIIEETIDFTLGRINVISENEYDTLLASTSVVSGHDEKKQEDLGYDEKENKDVNNIVTG